MQSPRGRISSKRRRFHEIVWDLRHTVFAVLRLRPRGNGLDVTALGSGFFAAPALFLTCHHVLNSNANPHQDGDSYHLLGRFAGKLAIHQIKEPSVGQDIFLYPECDLGLIKAADDPARPYAALSYEDLPEGLTLGVAGYPLPQLITTPQGQIETAGLIFRVAQGVVTASYEMNIQSDQGLLRNMPVIEVNFLFVPGSSGGPVFHGETGRVLGFVHGYSAVRIRERVETATGITDLPPGMSNMYIENVHAVYSLAVKLNRVRQLLEQFGATL